MGRIARDSSVATEWAIAGLGSAGLLVGVSWFDLVNRETGRGHLLQVFSTSTYGLDLKTRTYKSIPLPGASAATSLGAEDYELFRTRRPVNFESWDWSGVRLTQLNLGLIYGYSWSVLTVFDGGAYTKKPFAKVAMSGGGVMFPGGSIAHGVGVIAYGSGRPQGAVPRVLVPPDEKLPSGPRLAWVRSAASENPLLAIPGDALFDFDSAQIRDDARVALERATSLVVKYLTNWRPHGVEIRGHTDAKGTESYNRDLSLQRAKAVRQWFLKHGVAQAARFAIRGLGETQPVAPNARPDGSDDPAGRQRNRRVEIAFLR